VSILLQFAVFASAGVLHILRPDPFVRIVPAFIPWPLAVVYLSGAAELAGAIGLLIPRLRAAAGWGLIALLVAVFPANVHMLQLARESNASAWYVALLWGRLPLQPLLMWWVWRSAIHGRNAPRALSHD
jgi:uncharacterized membrane protein